MSAPARSTRPLAPLLRHSAAAGLAERLRPFRQRRALASLDVHVVDHLAALVGETDTEALLALALATRAPRHGHICVDLRALQPDSLLTEAGEALGAAGPDGEAPPLELMADRDAWLARVAASSLVRLADDPDSRTPFVLAGSLLYSDRYFRYQQRLTALLRQRFHSLQPPADPGLLASGLATLLGSPPRSAADGKAGAVATATPPVNRQQLAAAMALLRGMAVISGGPGAGKTYTVRSILTLLWAQWALTHSPEAGVPGPPVALAAPTGKAAARMREAIEQDLEPFLRTASGALPPGRSAAELRTFLTSLQPSTLHRLLRFDPGNPTRFRHHATNPVPFDVVVVDEASMVDFALMTKLVDAVGTDARLILLGDKNQLASVEAGTVLADLCGPTSVQHVWLSEAFAGELEQHAGLSLGAQVGRVPERGPQDAILQLDGSHRFGPDSGIGRFASACLSASTDPGPALAILTEQGRYPDMELLPHGERGSLPQEAQQQIVAGFLPYLQRLLAGPRPGETQQDFHSTVLALFDGFRILSAHRRGRLGARGLNDAVVELLVQEKARLAREFRQAGRVGQPGARHALSGFRPKGDFWVGRPILVRRNDYVVGRFNGDIGLVVRGPEGRSAVAFADEGRVVYLPPARLPEHQTVFAMTIHKSQGSEYGHAMVVLPEGDSRILTRELIYTGVTRAKRRVTVVGAQEQLRVALGCSVQRASGLGAELWGAAGR